MSNIFSVQLLGPYVKNNLKNNKSIIPSYHVANVEQEKRDVKYRRLEDFVYLIEIHLCAKGKTEKLRAS